MAQQGKVAFDIVPLAARASAFPNGLPTIFGIAAANLDAACLRTAVLNQVISSSSSVTNLYIVTHDAEFGVSLEDIGNATIAAGNDAIKVRVVESPGPGGSDSGPGLTGEEVHKLRKLIHAPRFPPSGPRHTTSYEQFYQENSAATTKVESLLKAPTTIPEGTKIPELPRSDADENNVMIPNFLKALAKVFGAEMFEDDSGRCFFVVGEFKVVDTHSSGTSDFFEGSRPDITIVEKGYGLSTYSTVAVMELQKGPLDNKHRGKSVKYCYQLLGANLERTSAICLLTNMEQLQVFQVRREGGRERVVCSEPLEMKDKGWQVIYQLQTLSADGLGHTAPQLIIGTKVYKASTLLGFTARAKVYQVGSNTACKAFSQSRGRAFQAELLALEKLSAALELSELSEDDRHVLTRMFPRLKDRCSKQLLLITEPIVKRAEAINNSALRLLMKGMELLHKNVKILHRDLEVKHIGLDVDGNLCLIDLGSAASLTDDSESGSEPGYRGTLMFASDDVLSSLENGCLCVPHARQDLVALSKSLYMLLHPTAMRELEEAVGEHKEPRDAAAAVRGFWNKELAWQDPGGIAWRDALKTADREDPQYDQLLQCLGVFVRPG